VKSGWAGGREIRVAGILYIEEFLSNRILKLVLQKDTHSNDSCKKRFFMARNDCENLPDCIRRRPQQRQTNVHVHGFNKPNNQQLRRHTSDDEDFTATGSTRRISRPYRLAFAAWKRSIAPITVGCSSLFLLTLSTIIALHVLHFFPFRDTNKNLIILFPTTASSKTNIPSEKRLENIHATKSWDYGGLQIEMVKYPFQRNIPFNEFARFERFRSQESSPRTNDTNDRHNNIPYNYWYYEDKMESYMKHHHHHLSCRPPAWSKLHFPNCNIFHEMSLIERDPGNNEIYTINHGFYRDVWVHRFLPDGTASVLKTTKYHHHSDFSWRNIMDVHREALIMERLTIHDNIVTPYGHCGTSVITEAIPYQVEPYIVPGTGHAKQKQLLRDPQKVPSKNALSGQEKLKTALEMAESIAVLHGFPDGTIVHNDIQLQQWLRTHNDTLKLGDFNRAMILNWNAKENRYCKYSSGTVFGNVRLEDLVDGRCMGQTNRLFLYCLVFSHGFIGIFYCSLYIHDLH
jgi:hypothetical protein